MRVWEDELIGPSYSVKPCQPWELDIDHLMKGPTVSVFNWESKLDQQHLKELWNFRAFMVKRRIEMGWSIKDLRKALAHLRFRGETGSLFWTVADVQEWCRALGGKLVIHLEDLPPINMEAVDEHVLAMAAAFKEDELYRWTVMTKMRQVRVAAGVTTMEMGRRMGQTPSSVGGWEQDTPNPLIPTVMWRVQVLGGHVRLEFVPTEPDLEDLGPAGRRK